MQTAYVEYSFLWLLNSLGIHFEGEVVNQDLDETVLLQQISCFPKLIKITVLHYMLSRVAYYPFAFGA